MLKDDGLLTGCLECLYSVCCLFFIIRLLNMWYKNIQWVCFWLAGQRVNDGLWHSVSLSARGLQMTMTLDNEPASTIQLKNYLEPKDKHYFGGKIMHKYCWWMAKSLIFFFSFFFFVDVYLIFLCFFISVLSFCENKCQYWWNNVPSSFDVTDNAEIKQHIHSDLCII